MTKLVKEYTESVWFHACLTFCTLEKGIRTSQAG
jgi:hypothetical protein